MYIIIVDAVKSKILKVFIKFCIELLPVPNFAVSKYSLKDIICPSSLFSLLNCSSFAHAISGSRSPSPPFISPFKNVFSSKPLSLIDSNVFLKLSKSISEMSSNFDDTRDTAINDSNSPWIISSVVFNSVFILLTFILLTIEESFNN